MLCPRTLQCFEIEFWVRQFLRSLAGQQGSHNNNSIGGQFRNDLAARLRGSLGYVVANLVLAVGRIQANLSSIGPGEI